MIVPMPFDLEEKEKTNHHDLNHKTHVANAFSEEIAARVTANIQHLTSTDEKTDGGIRIGPISGNLGIENEEKYEYINQLPGFVKIMSGSFIAFPESGDDGRVFVSIASGSRVIADNFPVINDYSVIVDADGFIQNTEYGHIWVDVRGRDHEPTKPNEQEEK